MKKEALSLWGLLYLINRWLKVLGLDQKVQSLHFQVTKRPQFIYFRSLSRENPILIRKILSSPIDCPLIYFSCNIISLANFNTHFIPLIITYFLFKLIYYYNNKMICNQWKGESNTYFYSLSLVNLVLFSILSLINSLGPFGTFKN